LEPFAPVAPVGPGTWVVAGVAQGAQQSAEEITGAAIQLLYISVFNVKVNNKVHADQETVIRD